MARRVWRWLGFALLGLVLVAAGGGWWLSRHFDRDRLVALLSAQALQQTGRQLHIDGRLALRLWPWPAVTLEGVRLANPAGLSRPDMLLAQSAVFELALRPLFDRRFELQQIALSGVDLLLETDARGRGNWEFTPPPRQRSEPAPAEPGAAPMHIVLDRIDIDDSKLAWRGSAGRTDTLELTRVRVSRADAGSKLDARLRLNGQALQLSGTTGPLGAFGAGAALPVDLLLTTDGAELAARGTVGGSVAKLSLRAKLSDIAAVSRASGRALAWPAALRLPATASAEIEQRALLTTLSAFKLEGAGWSLAGQGTVDRAGRRPRLTGSLTSSALDLSAPAAKGAAAANRATPSSHLFSAEPWPTPSWPDVDAQLRFDLARLRLTPQLELAALRGRLVLGPGGLHIDPLAMQVAGGTVNGTLALKQPPGAAPTLAIDARAQGVTLEALAAMAGFASLTGGRSDLRVNVSGHAASARSFASSLNGLVVLDAGPAQLRQAQGGALLGKLIDAIHPLTGVRGSTEIGCIAARLPFAAGVTRFDRSLAAQSAAFDLAASGRIDLGAETLDIVVSPSLRKAGVTVGPTLAPPVRLQGPLAAPKLVVDAKGTANAALAIGAAVASGGLSTLGQRLLGGPADAQPCVTALSGKAPPAAAAKAPPRLPWLPR